MSTIQYAKALFAVDDLDSNTIARLARVIPLGNTTPAKIRSARFLRRPGLVRHNS
jgi:hypothetical protein